MTFFRLCLQRKFRADLAIKLVLLYLFMSVANAQSGADYLKSLEGEASTLHLDDKTTDLQNKLSEKNVDVLNSGLQSKPGGRIVELQPGLTIEQFGIVLKNNYIGSYFFFKRLNGSQQEEVYQYYNNNPDPQKIREKILQVNKR